MEKYVLEKDINVIYLEAKSFPYEIKEAFRRLHSKIHPNISLIHPDNRVLFGISRPENGVIVYKAAAEELEEGEAKWLNLNSFTVKQGDYISILIKDYEKDISKISEAFQQLIKRTDIDPEGYCIEQYLGKDVRCMIKLKYY